MTENGNGENQQPPKQKDELAERRRKKEEKKEAERRTKPIPPVPSPGALNDLADRLGIDPNDLRKQGINIPERPTLPPPTPIDKKRQAKEKPPKKPGTPPDRPTKPPRNKL